MDARSELVEAAYRFDLSESAQLAGLLNVFDRRYETGRPLFAFTSSLRGGRAVYRSLVAANIGRVSLDGLLLDEHAAVPTEDIHRMYFGEPSRRNLATLVNPLYRPALQALGIREFVAVSSPTGTGSSVVIGAIHDDAHSIVASEQNYWAPIAHHLAAAQRIREQISLHVDGIFRVDRGNMEPDHLAAIATEPTVRDALRTAVLQRERVRAGKRSSDTALWPALILGQWTLIDRFDSAGARYLLVVRNPPGCLLFHTLTTREHRVVEAQARGDSNKVIAIELGVSEPTVSRAAHSALTKLGFRLAELLAATSASVAEIDIGSDDVGLVELKSGISLKLPLLTAAEQSVVIEAVRGQSVATIAASRGVATRTVINQLASAFEKLRVRSRRELILAVCHMI
jgi:DNA-binding NarL/FixJ family response regulator